jgi:uncharacterized membrane protein YccC
MTINKSLFASFSSEKEESLLTYAWRTAGPPLLFGLRLWASVCLALYVAFWLELENAYWAATSAALVCQPALGASLRKGWFRMIGTLVGATVIVLLTACFPQSRATFLISMALWGGACAFAATLLRNYAAYAAALAGYTAAIIASDQLGATGGLNGLAFTLVLTRVSEIFIGIVCAGVVLAGTDLGGARRRLARLLADLAAGIMAHFNNTLERAGPGLPDTQPVRRGFLQRVIALDPLIDQTIGESSQIRYHAPELQRVEDGLLDALSGWRAIAHHVVRLPAGQARAEAEAVLNCLPPALLALLRHAEPGRWMANPAGLRRMCEAGARGLIALPAATPSQRLLADKAAEALIGIMGALDGLALLVAGPDRRAGRPGRGFRLHVADFLPPLVNAVRAFVTIGAVSLFWVVTAWPNGATAITWAAISVILFSTRADQAYDGAWRFAVGNCVAVGQAAVMAFAVLPKLQTFGGLSLAIGAYMVPFGALMAQPWQTALFVPMVGNFFPVLLPANQMSYDTELFYNNALALVGGCAAAAFAFRLLPLSPALRARRLLALTLRDLRRVAGGRQRRDWQFQIHGRLAAMPADAPLLQLAQLLAALAAGNEIIRLRGIAGPLRIGTALERAFAATARGDIAGATAQLNRLDATLATPQGAAPDSQSVLRARAGILALTEVLGRHQAYFDAGPH